MKAKLSIWKVTLVLGGLVTLLFSQDLYSQIMKEATNDMVVQMNAASASHSHVHTQSVSETYNGKYSPIEFKFDIDDDGHIDVGEAHQVLESVINKKASDRVLLTRFRRALKNLNKDERFSELDQKVLWTMPVRKLFLRTNEQWIYDLYSPETGERLFRENIHFSKHGKVTYKEWLAPDDLYGWSRFQEVDYKDGKILRISAKNRHHKLAYKEVYNGKSKQLDAAYIQVQGGTWDEITTLELMRVYDFLDYLRADKLRLLTFNAKHGTNLSYQDNNPLSFDDRVELLKTVRSNRGKKSLQ